MKKSSLIAMLTAGVLLLSACGKAENSGKSSESNSKTSSNESVDEKGTRTVKTVMGDIEVPNNVERVVVNWYVGDVITAGLNIVGYSAWNQETMPFTDILSATKQLENWAPEDVMAVEPDLIVTYDKEDFEKFKKIAPVLVIEESVSSPERAVLIGEAAGNADTAKANVKTFEEKLAKAKETFKGDAFAGKSFSILEDWGPTGEWSGVAYETGSRGGTLVYDYLGLEIPAKLVKLIEDTGEGRNTLSYEVAHEYFGDYIIWFQQEGKVSEYQKSEIWKSIPAVVEGNIVEIPGENLGLFFYSDVLSLTAQLDFLVDAINNLAD